MSIVLRRLLGDIKRISANYEQSAPDNFNIFSILHKEHDEVRLHSRFIHEMLNPEGRMGVGSKFLEAFLNRINLREKFTITDDVRVDREDKNIDLLIRNRSQAIIIENKIYAADQPKQLQRYYENLVARGYAGNQIFIVYMTLFGSEPDEDVSFADLSCCSYKEDIRGWIEVCIGLIARVSQAAESVQRKQDILLQYKELIEKLTGQDQLMEEKGELRKAFEEQGALKAYFEARNIAEECMVDVAVLFWKELKDALGQQGISADFVDYQFTARDMEELCRNVVLGRPKSEKLFGLKCELDVSRKLDKTPYSVSLFIEHNNKISFGLTYSVDEVRREVDITQVDEALMLPDELKASDRWGKNNQWWMTQTYPSYTPHFGNLYDPVFLNITDKVERQRIVHKLADDVSALFHRFEDYTKWKQETRPSLGN